MDKKKYTWTSGDIKIIKKGKRKSIANKLKSASKRIVGKRQSK